MNSQQGVASQGQVAVASPALERASADELPQSIILGFLNKHCILLCVILVSIACARIISTYDTLSLTADEPAHLAAAVEYWSQHTISLDLESPPLATAIQALPIYASGEVRLTGRTNLFEEGAAIVAGSRDFDRTLFLMRVGTLPFFLLACFVVGCWANHYFGKAAAAIAVALYTLLPTSLADAGLLTTDMALAATTGAAFLAIVFWAEKPTWSRACVISVCVTLAFLSKSSAIGYLGLAVVLAVYAYWLTSPASWRESLSAAVRRAPTFVLAVVLTLLLMWSVYWFSFGPVPRLGVTVPAPEFFEGLLTVFDHNRLGHSAYFLGEYRQTGWWYYFPVAIAVKTPIAFLILLAIGLAVCVKRRQHLAYLLPLALVVGVLLPAMRARIDIGIRHIAPAYLAFSVIGSLGVIRLLETKRLRSLSRIAVLALVAWMSVSVAIQHPDYLAYFNAFAGSHPENLLVDSNYDWGQDLRMLAKHLRSMGVNRIALASLDGAVKNEYRESWYGLPVISPLDIRSPSPGWTVISATFDKSFRFQFPDLAVKNPWYEQLSPTERFGPYFLYYTPPHDTDIHSAPADGH